MKDKLNLKLRLILASLMKFPSKSQQRWHFLTNLIKFYYYYIKSRSSKTRHGNKPYVYFNIESRISERHYTHLLFCFNLAGIPLKLKNNIHFIGNASTYVKEIPRLPFLKLVNKNPSPDKCLLVITDRSNDPANLKYPKKIILSTEIFKGGKIQSDNLMPFFMIPRLYFSGFYKASKKFAENRKRIFKIFFSGNQNPTQYNRSEFKTIFNKMTRIEILDALKDNLQPDEIAILTDKNDDYKNKFVYSKWSRKSIGQSKIKGRVENSEWLRILSQSHFFLACPGYIQPMCHNVIEAMSVGAIPVLEYSEFFNPPLIHNENSIVFSGKEDLLNKFSEIFKLSEEDIHRMRTNVLDYYDQFLKPEAVVRNLLNSDKAVREMHLIESAFFLNYNQNRK